MFLEEYKPVSRKEKFDYAEKMPEFAPHDQNLIAQEFRSSQFTDERSHEEYYVQFNRAFEQLNTRDDSSFQRNIQDSENSLKLMNRILEIYRMMEQHPLVSQAICQIVDEAMQFNNDPESDPIKITFNTGKLRRIFPGMVDEDIMNLRHEIENEFTQLLIKFNFRDCGYELFKRWYVDGKIFFELVFDIKDPHSSIKKIIPLSPFNLVKIRVFERDGKRDRNGRETGSYNYYYLYDPRCELKREARMISGRYNDFDITNLTRYDGSGQLSRLFYEDASGPILIPEKYILCVESGLKNMQGFPISYLNLAVKLLNQLVLLQDFMIVYRLSRSVEKRAFYIDVGKIHPSKADQYVASVARQLKQKMIYDFGSGTVLDHKHLAGVTEDLFIPRFDNGQTTEVRSIDGGTSLDKIDDIEYFQKELYKALQVPLSRFYNDNAVVNLGRDVNVSRDEITFMKFILRLRRQFNRVFFQALRVQLINKRIVPDATSYENLEQCINIIYDNDNYYSKIKDLEMLQHKLGIFQQVEGNIERGQFSESWAYQHIMGFSRAEIDDFKTETVDRIEEELAYWEHVKEAKMRIAEIQGEIRLAEDPEFIFKMKYSDMLERERAQREQEQQLSQETESET